MTKRALVLILFLVWTAICLPPAQGARLSQTSVNGNDPPEKTAEPRVSIDFRDADVRVVGKFISELTGKNFIFDSQVRDKVTMFSPTPVTPEEAYKLFEMVLKAHNLTTIPTGDIIRIVPSVKARTLDVETRPKLPAPGTDAEDRVVTQLIRLKYANAAEMMNMLRPLIDKTGMVMSYESGNTMIVTDYASNIERLMEIINSLDVRDEGLQMVVIDLQHASAKDMAVELREVLEAVPIPGQPMQAVQGAPGGGTGLQYKVVADERSNSLIVMARIGEIEMIRSLAHKLDSPSERGSDRVHVIFLKHAIAEDLAKTISELAGQSTKKEGEQSGPPQPVLLRESVFITAEKSTNALIIRASREDFQVLENIIQQLDIQRAQVLVEGVVMETTISKANALGAEWRLLNFPENNGQTIAVGGTNLPTTDSSGLISQFATQPLAGPSGMILGAAKGTITFNGQTFLNLGLLIQALQQDTDVNILSTPHIVTMDNEEARIVVGEERPFLQSSMATSTGAVSPTITNTYEFKDLGLTLKITPHITQGEYIKLKIYQDLKSFVSETQTGAITSTKRETETTVLVRDRDTVVIGGMIQDQSRQNRSQVPCLGDVPGVGWGFKRRNQSSDKLNLIILITPSIIRTAESMKELTDRKLNETEKADRPDEPKGKEFPQRGLDMLKDPK